MWLIHQAFGAALFFGCSFAQQDPKNPNLTSAFDIIEELRTLRDIQEENRKRIAKHDTELVAIKYELDEAKRNCNCRSTDNVAIPAMERTGDPQLNENRIQKGRSFSFKSVNELLIRRKCVSYIHFIHSCLCLAHSSLSQHAIYKFILK